MVVIYENIYKGNYPRLIMKAAPDISIISYKIHVSGGRVCPAFVSIDVKYEYDGKIYKENIKRDEFDNLDKLRNKLYKMK